MGDRELRTPRLILEPLRVEHAEEMWPVLDDPGLHAFTGGRPATREALIDRYARQVTGRAPDGRARWLNWIVRRRGDRVALGFVQATVTEGPPRQAELAWTIAAAFQGNGYAREAAAAIAGALAGDGIERLQAHIHPRHRASIAVARSLGLAPGEARGDGEIRWTGSATAPPARP
jgi:RimJ/RimL family protein N-acetyltransferase